MNQKIIPDQIKINIINKAGVFDQRLLLATNLYTKTALQFRRNFLKYYFIRPPLWKVLLRAALSSNRMTPDFSSIGAVRSGTSLLSDYIMQHPCVALPLAKEIWFMRIPTKKMIMANFPTLSSEKNIIKYYGKAITGCCAPVMPFLEFPYIAKALSPNMKFIIIMRDPVERTFAHWRWDQMKLAKWNKDSIWQKYPNFDEAIRIELESIHYNGGGMRPYSGMGTGGYIQHSIYLPFLKNLLKCYDKSNMLFINANDFFSNPISVVQQVYSFLELPDYDPIEMPVKNAAIPAKMNESTRSLLQDFFLPINKELYDFIGKDMNW